MGLLTRVATRLSTAPAATTLSVEDLRRARAFCKDALGFDVQSRADMPEDLFVRAGGESLILLYDRGRGGSGDATSVTFEVDDLEAVVAELRDKGVAFEEDDFPGAQDRGRHRQPRGRQGGLVPRRCATAGRSDRLRHFIRGMMSPSPRHCDKPK